jgi:hypothetical protein
MITDTFLQRIAGLINGESVAIPAYGAFSSTVLSADATRTSLPDELDATRLDLTKTRTGTTTTYTFLRSGSVASSSGDYINTMALIDSATGGYVLSDLAVPSLLHTTSFDVEVDWKVQVRRVL